jgi:hypothetical protein
MNAPGGACHVTRWPNWWAWVRGVLDAKEIGVLMKLLGKLAENFDSIYRARTITKLA